jgi:hypothetical protein
VSNTAALVAGVVRAHTARSWASGLSSAGPAVASHVSGLAAVIALVPPTTAVRPLHGRSSAVTCNVSRSPAVVAGVAAHSSAAASTAFSGKVPHFSAVVTFLVADTTEAVLHTASGGALPCEVAGLAARVACLLSHRGFTAFGAFAGDVSDFPAVVAFPCPATRTHVLHGLRALLCDVSDRAAVVALLVGGVLRLVAFARDVAELAAVVAGGFLGVGAIAGLVARLTAVVALVRLLLKGTVSTDVAKVTAIVAFLSPIGHLTCISALVPDHPPQ